MLKAGDKVKIIAGLNNQNIYEVRKKGGVLGIDYNTNHSQYISKGDIFVPFSGFAWRVIFENIENGKKYYFSNIEKQLCLYD